MNKSSDGFVLLIFHATVLSPLADILGKSSKWGKRKTARDEALAYLRGDYEYELEAPEWIQEVFRKAKPDEIAWVTDSKSAAEAFGKLVELRSALVQRWAGKSSPVSQRRIVLPKHRKHNRYDSGFAQRLVGLTRVEAQGLLGLRPSQLSNFMHRNGLRTEGHGGRIVYR